MIVSKHYFLLVDVFSICIYVGMAKFVHKITIGLHAIGVRVELDIKTAAPKGVSFRIHGLPYEVNLHQPPGRTPT
jgi:hypothetical protein